jgi:hypothetical protein
LLDIYLNIYCGFVITLKNSHSQANCIPLYTTCYFLVLLLHRDAPSYYTAFLSQLQLFTVDN